MSPPASQSFAHDVHAVAAVRRFIRSELDALAPDIVDLAELLGSELATNAVRHTDRPFTVAITPTTDGVRIAVSDAAGGIPVERARDIAALHGRGLALVSSLSRAWGVEPGPGRGPGKTVWFELADPADQSAVATDQAAAVSPSASSTGT